MKNKEIQEQRMKQYFIQATKEILKGEGIKGVSVRNIADRAGYSYATLYNYFKDVNDLIFLCVNDFQDECRQFVLDRTMGKSSGLGKLKDSVLAYVGYFVEYPGVFNLFYLAQVGDFGNKQSTINVISNSLYDVLETEWIYCRTNQLLPAELEDRIQNQLRYTVIGLLLLYLNRRTPDSYAEFIQEANVRIDGVLGL